MTGFGSFDNNMCKKVLNLLEPGDLTLGHVVIKTVEVAYSLVLKQCCQNTKHPACI